MEHSPSKSLSELDQNTPEVLDDLLYGANEWRNI
jgi:hypothetical protein